jgi:uncharacterized protein (DUF302 family)
MNTSSTFTTSHVRVATAKDFGETRKIFEQQLGKFDSATLQSLLSQAGTKEEIVSRIETMMGSSGFTLFGTADHGSLLSRFGELKKAIQYVVGNPLIAVQMTRRNLAAGLYAPLRVLIYEEDGKTFLEYDKPSSFFRQFEDAEIDAVASMLDEKLEALVAAAIG